ncbi:MAG: TolC family protein [Chitinophagaceae bacterium]|nr:TolC family protein [Chitinophagaceae bacterium]
MRRISWVLILFCSFTATAQQNVLSLEEAIATSLRNNYDILMARNDSTSFALDRSYVYAAFLPRLNGTAQRVWNTNAQKQELPNGSKRDTSGIKSNNTQFSLNLGWTLFDGLKMFATRDRVIQLTQLGTLTVKNQVVVTVADLINTYYNIVRSKLQLKAIDEQISINEERVKLADKKFSVGLGAKPELLQAKVDLNAQRAARLRQLTLVEQLKEQLNQRMAVEPTTRYEVMDSIPINTGLQYGELQANIASTNPLILIAQKNIDIANIIVRERRADYFPILTFNSAYNFNRLENKAVINQFTPLFNLNRGLNFGFGLTVPIFNNFNTRRLVEQAKLDVEYQQLFFKNQVTLIDVALSNSFQTYELEKRSLILEEENITLARENVNIALERFRQGVSTYLELREAQISLEQALDRLISARYNTKLAETELLRLKGDLVR